MKMQEVIVKLREHAPVVEACARDALRGFDSLHDVLGDATRAGSQESLRTLLALCLDKSQYIRGLLQHAEEMAGRLNSVNQAYKEKIGPRAKKPKDAEGQQMLPGMGVAGEMSGTPAESPTWTTSGRHG